MTAIKVRHPTAAALTSANRTYPLAQLIQESDTGKVKVTDGVTAWTVLPYLLRTGDALSLLGAAAGDLDLGTHKLLHVATGTVSTDGVNKGQMDAAIAAAVAALVNSAPGVLDTLEEIADALGDDANFAATMTTALAGKVPTTRLVSAGTGLTGGGDMTADRTLAVAYGTTAGTAAQGNDTRLSDARTPTAHAATHVPGGTDALTTATAGASAPGDTAAAGSAASFARSDHRHSREVTATMSVFAATGTYTKPTGATRMEIFALGGGGAGASGRRGGLGTVRCGGGGGGGGMMSYASVDASLFGSTETVTVGTGGAGGAAVTANTTDGNAGGNGNQSYVGTSSPRICQARGGLGGSGGTALGGAGGAATAPGASTGAAASSSGGSGGNGGGVAACFGTSWTAGGGGAGGGITTGDVAAIGGTGSPCASDTNGATAGAVNGNGNPGTAPKTNSHIPGGGGSGGGASTTGAAGAGGAGSFGGGGGGGGGSAPGNNSGAGGNGGDGLVVIITYFD